jgi:hypothetical protein
MTSTDKAMLHTPRPFTVPSNGKAKGEHDELWALVKPLLDVPETNAAAVALAKRHGMAGVFEAASFALV